MKTIKQTSESLISTFDNNKVISFTDVKFVEEFSKTNGNCLANEVSILIFIFENKHLMSFNLLHTIVKQFDFNIKVSLIKK